MWESLSKRLCRKLFADKVYIVEAIWFTLSGWVYLVLKLITNMENKLNDNNEVAQYCLRQDDGRQLKWCVVLYVAKKIKALQIT